MSLSNRLIALRKHAGGNEYYFAECLETLIRQQLILDGGQPGVCQTKIAIGEWYNACAPVIKKLQEALPLWTFEFNDYSGRIVEMDKLYEGYKNVTLWILWPKELCETEYR